MLLKASDGHWYTTNPLNLIEHSPDGLSLLLLEHRQERRRLIKKHFEVRCEGDFCNLYFHGKYVACWLKGSYSKYRAAMMMATAVAMYKHMGGI